MTNDEPIEAEKFDDKELCALNLFFGIIILVFSIFFLISILMFTINIQITIISISLLIIGLTFTGIGIPDKHQGIEAATLEIICGSIATGVGILSFFVSLISSNLMYQMLFIIDVIFLFPGIVAIIAPYSEDRTKDRSKQILGGSGIIIVLCSGFGILFYVLDIFDLILFPIINIIFIMLLIALFLHGLARIIIYRTGIYE